MSPRTILPIVFLLGLSLFFSPCPAAAGDLGFRNIAIGNRYPGFCGERVGGGRLCADDLANRVTVIMFFRPGQDLSARQLGVLHDLRSEYQPDKVSIVAIAEKSEAGSDLADLVRRTGITFPVLDDQDKKLAGLFGAYAFPCTGVFSRNGALRTFAASNWVDYRNVIDGELRILLGKAGTKTTGQKTSREPAKIDTAVEKAETSYNLAKILFDSGELDKAEKVLEESLAGYEGHARSHLLLSRIARQKHDQKKSESHLHRALELDPALKAEE